MTRRPLWLATSLFLGFVLTINGNLLGQESDATDAPKAGEQASETPTESKPSTLPDAWMKTLRWRSIGPANMSGRITSLAVYEADPCIWWAATASGGLLKTTNDGASFEHQFDSEATVSIGDVQVAQSDPEIVWVGTGESNPRNSVSWGNGVYKSTDGGETWKHMGLEGSFQIGRMAIHPTNPDVVYVGALGRLWGPNEERGLFKTSDGGETWDKVLYVDELTGVIDVNLAPGEPDTLLVATYERERDGFDTNDPAKKWGPGSGIWKSTDAGANWERVTTGLPSADLGRIDIEYYRADSSVVYALVESSTIGQEPENAAYAGFESTNADVGARITKVVEGSPAEEAEIEVGDIVIGFEDEIVQSSSDLRAKVRRHLADDTVQLEVSRDRESVLLELTFERKPEEKEDPEEEAPEAEAAPEPDKDKDADKPSDEASTKPRDEAAAKPGDEETIKPEAGGEAEPAAKAEEPEATEEEEEEEEIPAPFRTWLGGQVPNAQDQQGPDGHEYGGLYKSTDGGVTWTRINSVNPRPMYFSQLRVDPSDDQHLYVLGISLYRSKDGGEEFTSDGGGGGVHVDHHALWIDPSDGRHTILGNDGGIYVTRDRLDTWEHKNRMAIGQFYHVAIGPRDDYWVYGGLQDNGTWGGPGRVRNGSGAKNEDWLSIGGGDGFVCRVDPEDPDRIYFESQNGSIGVRNLATGARSSLRPRAERGERLRWNWQTPFILSSHNPGIYYTAGNFVYRSWLRGADLEKISPEITNTDRGSATVVAESPVDADVLYVGTDDGALWGTQNGGEEWTNLFPVDSEEPEAPGEQAELVASVEDPEEHAPNGKENGHERQADESKSDALTGLWTLTLQSEEGGGGGAGNERRGRRAGGRRAQSGAGDVTIDLKLEGDGSLTGSMTSFRGDTELSESEFAAESGNLTLRFGDESPTTITAKVEGDSMKGSLDFNGRFQREFTGARSATGKPVRDDGHDWKSIAELVETPMWVGSIETSGFEPGRVYLALDGHRSNRDETFVFVSEDFGATWRSLTAHLPAKAGTARVIREDLENENVLYLGTEFGAWVTIDRGETWTSMNTNLPTVAVHEFAQHPTQGDVVAATHGRSLWVLDVTPIRQLSTDAITAEAKLYEPKSATYWRTELRTGATIGRFMGQNPPGDAQIYYSVGKGVSGLSLRVKDLAGEILADLETSSEPGLHHASWNLRPASGDAPAEGRRRRRAPRVAPGTYLVELKYGNQALTQPLTVRGDPTYPDAVLWGEAYEEQMELEEFFAAEEEAPGAGATD